MPRYFFHLAGRLPANDLIGHECINDEEAREHGSFIAHRVGTEKPDMVQETDEIGDTYSNPYCIYFESENLRCSSSGKNSSMPTSSITTQDSYGASATDLDAYGSTMGNDGIVALDGRFDLTAMAAYLNGTAETDTESNMQTP